MDITLPRLPVRPPTVNTGTQTIRFCLLYLENSFFSDLANLFVNGKCQLYVTRKSRIVPNA